MPRIGTMMQMGNEQGIVLPVTDILVEPSAYADGKTESFEKISAED